MKKVDNLMAWRSFAAVARTGSISVAAKILDTDSPSLSHLITDLERELGYPLLDRSKRPMKLTSRGRTLANMSAELCGSFQQMIEQFDVHNSIINVAAPTDLNQNYLHDQLFQYSLEHPSVQFYLRASCPIDDIFSGRIDVAMIDSPHPSAELVSRFCVKAIAVPMASRRYIEKNGYPETVKDLKNHTGLLLRQGMHPVTSFLYRENGEMSGILKWKHMFMTDAQLTLNHMMLEDMGIVIDCVPQHLLKELRSGEVVPVLPGWRRKPQELSIVTRKDREAMSDDLHEFALWWRATERAAAAARVEEAEKVLSEVMAMCPRYHQKKDA